MTYATKDDLYARFGETEILELADRDGDSIADSGVVEQALADADAMIDSYLSGRYDVPLADPPAQIVTIACDLARARLWTGEPPSAVTEALRSARDFLQRVSDGKLTLTNATGRVTATPADDVFEAEAPATRFDTDSLTGYLGASDPRYNGGGRW